MAKSKFSGRHSRWHRVQTCEQQLSDSHKSVLLFFFFYFRWLETQQCTVPPEMMKAAGEVGQRSVKWSKNKENMFWRKQAGCAVPQAGKGRKKWQQMVAMWKKSPDMVPRGKLSADRLKPHAGHFSVYANIYMLHENFWSVGNQWTFKFNRRDCTVVRKVFTLY